MFQSIAKTLGQLGDPRLRGVLVTAVLATLALILVLSALVGTGIDAIGATGIGWLDGILGLVDALGTVVLLVLLFPGMVQIISGLFADRVGEAIAGRQYPGLGQARRQDRQSHRLNSSTSCGFRKPT